MTKKNCFVLLSLLDDYISSCSYDLLVVGHGNVITLMMHLGSIYVLLWIDDYYLAHVILLSSLNWFRNKNLNIKSEISHALRFIPLFTKFVWLLVIHILSPKIMTEVELVHWFFLHCVIMIWLRHPYEPIILFLPMILFLTK